MFLLCFLLLLHGLARSWEAPVFTIFPRFDTDLGYVNLYNHFNMGDYAANYDMSTIWRLRCWDADTGGVERTMYLRGLASPSIAFYAGTTVDTTGVECADNIQFSNSASGDSCMTYNDASHTFWHLAADKGDVLWALFKDFQAHTLRHCGNHGGGTFSPGQIAFYIPGENAHVERVAVL